MDLLGQTAYILRGVLALLPSQPSWTSCSRLVYAQTWMDARLIGVKGEVVLRSQEAFWTLNRGTLLDSGQVVLVDGLFSGKTVSILGITVIKLWWQLSLFDILAIFGLTSRLRSARILSHLRSTNILECVNILIICGVAHVLPLCSLVINVGDAELEQVFCIGIYVGVA